MEGHVGKHKLLLKDQPLRLFKDQVHLEACHFTFPIIWTHCHWWLVQCAEDSSNRRKRFICVLYNLARQMITLPWQTMVSCAHTSGTCPAWSGLHPDWGPWYTSERLGSGEILVYQQCRLSFLGYLLRKKVVRSDIVFSLHTSQITRTWSVIKLYARPTHVVKNLLKIYFCIFCKFVFIGTW